jgi:hypothetical protein
MSPRLTAVIEYRFVRPEDVNPETDTVVTEAPRGIEGHYYRAAPGYAEVAEAMRKCAAEIRAGGPYGGPEWDRESYCKELERVAARREEAAPTAERTVCVRRATKP